MKRITPLIVLFLALSSVALWAQVRAPQTRRPVATVPQNIDMNHPLADCQKLFDQGLFKDALDILQPWTLKADADPKEVGGALKLAIQCFSHLNRASEIDDYREEVIKTHEKNWRLLQAAAKPFIDGNHNGIIIDGKFERGARRGGDYANAEQRDRVRALQLMQKASELAVNDSNKSEVAEFFFDFAEVWMSGRGNRSAWMLQNLTDLSTLPDYEKQRWFQSSQSNAPVDAKGDPIYYNSTKSFAEAKNDGERWRWCLDQAVENDSPGYLAKTLVQRANFSLSQFGVETMQEYGFFFRKERTKQDTQTWSLHTLKDNETIAKLADGVKRFELPDDWNYIKLGQQVVEYGTKDEKAEALEALAQIYENRRQYPKAAEYWNRLINDYPLDERKDYRKHQYDQIVKNWGRFEPTRSKAAGKGPDLQYLYRNGKSVQLTAQEILVPQLLADVKSYIKSKPARPDWQKLNINRIGYELVANPTQNAKYLGREVARWVTPLEPAENHFDRRTTITVPITASGAYLVKAEMEDGNTDFIVVWLSDTGIVRKQLDNALFYYFADAESGAPVPNANVEFFGYQARANIPGGRTTSRSNTRLDYEIKETVEKSNENGQLILGENRITQQLQWLITATTPAQGNKPGRFAYLGFDNVWYSPEVDPQYNEVKAFFISDRPVYRPKDTAQYKFWVGTAKYDAPENVSDFAGKEVVVEITSPRGERIEQKLYILDAYGGLVGELALPADAMLGVYGVSVFKPGPKQPDGIYEQSQYYGHGSFRVEEYKKPEYEVSVEAPTEPVALGEPITAKIKANYYFGSPVSNATVKYKVVREKHDATWFPVRPWDWFYGEGYWWFAYDYDWYPGWSKWGCARPTPAWLHHRSFERPEVVLEKEVPINPDGTVDVKFDTAFTKELYPNDDQKYTITAEVVDQSRRTIVGTGTVLVAKEPLKVYTWVDRGYYEPNQQINARFQTRRLDGKPVAGDAAVKVYKITYTPDKTPTETEVHSATIKFDETGTTSLALNAADPGQYRITALFNRYSAPDAPPVEGAYIFNVYGPAQAGTGSFTFNQLELIPGKEEYQPGEEVELRINTNRPDSTVLLFAKPANGVYQPPQLLKLQGKSTSVKIPVMQKDMPNFFVEAVCVSGGEVYTEMKELVVPPEKRIVNVDVTPSAETYKPGEKAKAKLVVTDQNGKPVVGQMVVSIYDKSAEYISGGSNVRDIKEFFWKWRRNHYPNTISSLQKYFRNFTYPDKPTLEYLGVFGSSVADEIGNDDGEVVEEAAMAFEVMDASGPVPGAMALPTENAMMKAAPMSAMGMGGMGGAPVLREQPKELASPRNEAPLVEATVRKEFADTALWVGALESDKDGVAEIELSMPDNLTTWKINVWAMGHGTKVGYGSSEVITRKDLIVRMQTPRFLVQKDQVLFTANVHNYLKTEKNVQVSLEFGTPGTAGILPAAGLADILSADSKNLVKTVTVPAGGEARVDWLVDAVAVGDAVIRMKALTDEESDAVENTIPVYVHGMLKQEAQSGFLKPEETSAAVEITVPKERRPEESKLTVRFSPTLAGAMIDALPYLADYPYGCTEQTLNRFLPTVITQKMLIEMGVDLASLEKEHTNLNAQHLTNRAGSVSERNRKNPVYNPDEVHKMTADGVARLVEMHLSDGGWGWFGGYGEYSSPHLTAQIVHGLRLAKDCDVAIPEGVIERGVEWLTRYQDKQVQRIKNGKLPAEQRKRLEWKSQADNIDALVYLLLAGTPRTAATEEMKNFLYVDRAKLSLYGVALLGLALHQEGDNIKSEMCRRMLEQYLTIDDENQTAYLELNRSGYDWCWWCWFDDEFETQAMYLKLLVRLDPKSDVAPKLVKYLLNNRKHGTYWNSTRDTALCVETLAEYLQATGENKPNMTVEILYDGVVKKTVEITPENMLAIDNTLILSGDELTDGVHKIELRKTGTGPLYFNTYLQNFTLEDPIAKTGLEVKIERRYYLLKRKENATQSVAGGRGQAVDQKVEKYDRVPLENLAGVKSGEQIEIELIVESKNDYEYLMIEDFKPAGFEPVELRSGYDGNGLGAYVEYRDNRVTFFVNRLDRGKHNVSYKLRAEQPGRFSALPAVIEAMYAPELKGNSDEFKVRVED